jgi:hypothetical protein
MNVKIKFKGGFMMLNDVKSTDANIIPPQLPRIFSAVFWMIPLKMSSSIKPVDSIIMGMAMIIFAVVKPLTIPGCSIEY